MNYQQTLDFLFGSLPVFQNVGGSAYKEGFDRIMALEALADNPHRKLRAVHVAGTNGKGSVSHMVASVLMAAGYRTGLFTSPHLRDFRERIRIDGEPISEQEVVDYVATRREAIDRIEPSFFELTTAIAFDAFARHGVDVAVVEVGMGGRLDSTNIIRPLVSTITNIGFDHMQFLGSTLEQIAGEKAGIIKEGVPVVIGERQAETELVFIERAKSLGAPILFSNLSYRIVEQRFESDFQHFEIESLLDGCRFGMDCDLRGIYQRKNILTVLSTLDVLNGAGGVHISREQVCEGVATAAARTHLLGRWQRLAQHPLTMCDTGHNESGLREVVEQLRRQHYNRLHMVVGFVADKDLERVLPLLPTDAVYYFTHAAISRALDSQELMRRAAAHGLHGSAYDSVAAALAAARKQALPDDMIFVGGSTYVVAEVVE